MSDSQARFPRVSVVTVNLDGRSHLEVLLESLSHQTYPADRFEVWVVDNGSRDGSVEWLREHHPSVRLIENRVNEGFARPNNQAASLADGDLLALVNNDMKLAPDWLERMVDALLASPGDVACIGSRILTWDGARVDFIGGHVAFHGMGLQPAFHAAVNSVEGTTFPDEILFACGGALLIRRNVFLEVGGFDEDFFAYFEDLDLGWRLWVEGYRVRFCPGAVAYHRHNGTSGRFDGRNKLGLLERNALCCVYKNYDDSRLDRVLPASLLLAIKRVEQRSGVDPGGFRFGTGPASPAQSGGTVPALGRIFSSLIRVGPRTTIRKLLLEVARRIQARWGGMQGVAETEVAIRRESYATLVGLSDFITMLPVIREKRRHIQSRRRRPDPEILPLFRSPLFPLLGEPAYRESLETVATALGVAELFSPLEPSLAQEATRHD